MLRNLETALFIVFILVVLLFAFLIANGAL